MILSDRDIRARLAKGDLVIIPLEDHQLTPSSIDLRLGNRIRIFKQADHSIIDPANYNDCKKYDRVLESGGKIEVHEYTDLYVINKPFIVHPHDFILGTSLERIELPADLGARLDGRSSLGRIGLLVHSTAGWIDPGFKGCVTLEITNVGKLPIKLYPGMRIGQLLVYQLSSPAEVPYDQRATSKYAEEKGATQSLINKDIEFL